MYWEDSFRNRAPVQQGKRQNLFQKKRPSRTAPRKAFLVFLFLVAQLIFYSCDLFKLQEVSVQGNSKTRTRAILGAAALPTGKNLFEVSLAGVKGRLAGLHWLKSVAVSKHYPSTITLDVTERVPLFRVMTRDGGGSAYTVDADGMVLEAADADRGSSALPLMEVFDPVTVGRKISKERVTTALRCQAWLPEAERPYVKSICVDRRFSIMVRYELLGNLTEVYLGMEKNLTPRTAKILSALLKWCEDRNRPVKYLNLKYPDKPALLPLDAVQEMKPIIHVGE